MAAISTNSYNAHKLEIRSEMSLTKIQNIGLLVAQHNSFQALENTANEVPSWIFVLHESR